MTVLVELAAVVSDVSAVYIDGSVEGDGQWLKLLPLLSGPAFFAFMYARYRNKGARHYHEHETEAHVTNLTGNDQKIKRITGTSASSLAGANHDHIRGARN